MDAAPRIAVFAPAEPAPAPDAGSRAEALEPQEILDCAEALGIPWKRLLLQEIEAEQELRRRLPGARGCPLPRALTILPLSFLQSWRVRDGIETLACQARAGSVRGAVRQLREVLRRLLGKGDREQEVFSQHLWLAYQRVLLLQRARRAAERSAGSTAERLAFVCSTTRCSYDDAAWAVGQEDAPGPGHRFEAAISKVRDEGFRIPRAESEARALTQLRRAVLALSAADRRRRSNTPKTDNSNFPIRDAGRDSIFSIGANSNSPTEVQQVVRGTRS
jgi:hypothetical protein